MYWQYSISRLWMLKRSLLYLAMLHEWHAWIQEFKFWWRPGSLHNWIQTRVLLQYSQDNFWTCNFHDFTTRNVTSLSFCRCWPIDLGWSQFVQIQENLISDQKVYMLQLNYRRINLITGFDLYSACCRLSNSRVVEQKRWSKNVLISNTCIWERGEWHMFGRVFLHYV